MPLTQVTLDMLDSTSGALGFRNKVINGSCRVAQRGSVAATNNSAVYGGADRIAVYPASFSTATGTIQQSGGNATASGFAQQVTLTTTGTGSVIFLTRLEAKDTAYLAGKSVTISARLYHNVGSAVNSTIQLYRANASDNFSAVTQIQTTVNTGSIPDQTWTDISATFAIGASEAANGLMIFWQFASVGAVTSKTFAIGNMQMVEGTIVTPFEMPPMQYELALCQRYYYRNSPGAVARNLGIAAVIGTAAATVITRFPVSMRIAPSAIEQSGTANQYQLAITGSGITCSSVPTHQSQTTVDEGVSTFTVGSGLVAGQAGTARTDSTNGANAYLAWSAEL